MWASYLYFRTNDRWRAALIVLPSSLNNYVYPTGQLYSDVIVDAALTCTAKRPATAKGAETFAQPARTRRAAILPSVPRPQGAALRRHRRGADRRGEGRAPGRLRRGCGRIQPEGHPRRQGHGRGGTAGVAQPAVQEWGPGRRFHCDRGRQPRRRPERGGFPRGRGAQRAPERQRRDAPVHLDCPVDGQERRRHHSRVRRAGRALPSPGSCERSWRAPAAWVRGSAP